MASYRTGRGAGRDVARWHVASALCSVLLGCTEPSPAEPDRVSRGLLMTRITTGWGYSGGHVRWMLDTGGRVSRPHDPAPDLARWLRSEWGPTDAHRRLPELPAETVTQLPLPTVAEITTLLADARHGTVIELEPEMAPRHGTFDEYLGCAVDDATEAPATFTLLRVAEYRQLTRENRSPAAGALVRWIERLEAEHGP